ncbi:hypothetical protein CCM_02728 [Cordyceps militaris CM01]|uniref:Uncharacterized protein n=1 Tax=Cordyceps militaris (strain CM01) TaxID=983644 RepID=G3JBF0_CORMM|nr:uncharacterized protein CCM_02728 [Cordyceps militaris CM01]EGX94457.1 hypothetical protein CCM_02728 [Cordyceps militaris CM01]
MVCVAVSSLLGSGRNKPDADKRKRTFEQAIAANRVPPFPACSSSSSLDFFFFLHTKLLMAHDFSHSLLRPANPYPVVLSTSPSEKKEQPSLMTQRLKNLSRDNDLQSPIFLSLVSTQHPGSRHLQHTHPLQRNPRCNPSPGHPELTGSRLPVSSLKVSLRDRLTCPVQASSWQPEVVGVCA